MASWQRARCFCIGPSVADDGGDAIRGRAERMLFCEIAAVLAHGRTSFRTPKQFPNRDSQFASVTNETRELPGFRNNIPRPLMIEADCWKARLQRFQQRQAVALMPRRKNIKVREAKKGLFS
jgi:hypothetical protein